MHLAKNSLSTLQAFYECHGMVFSNLRWHQESLEYGACQFTLNGLKIEHRISKITPTKTGQFVTIWKRNNEDITLPLHLDDEFDYLIITSIHEDCLGQFVFSKNMLVNNGVISTPKKSGKRGMRVYPSWDKTNSKQALKTQQWQSSCFVILADEFAERFKALLNS